MEVSAEPVMGQGLTRLVNWAQRLIAEVLQGGDLAVDLTAGGGRDTLFLAERVGVDGTVIAFDIQEEALRQTTALLHSARQEVRLHDHTATPADLTSGVHLLLASHADFSSYLPAPAAAIIANLGYLPGYVSGPTTNEETTLSALEKAFAVLKEGGRIAIIAYVGHPGGENEAVAVAALFARLDHRHWQVLRLNIENLSHAPFLLVAEKKHRVQGRT